MKKIILLFSAVLFSSATFVQSQPLAYNLKEGETYRQNMSVTSTVKQSMMGQTMEINVQSETHIAFKVAEITATGYKFEVVFTKIAFNTSIPGMGTMSYGSEEETATSPGFENVSKLLRAMKGVPFFAEMTKRGEITGVTGLTAMNEKIIAELGTGAAEAE